MPTLKEKVAQNDSDDSDDEDESAAAEKRAARWEERSAKASERERAAKLAEDNFLKSAAKMPGGDTVGFGPLATIARTAMGLKPPKKVEMTTKESQAAMEKVMAEAPRGMKPPSGGKRRKTRRKSKTHKRKSNKKMRRSRKSRRRR